ncbi:type VI secretion system protein ImpM [Rhodobacter aestuarii]|uniref:Type VI secretion system protein ImpM n=1 Tax=Rhodobacter aestuarii TaxID=453582 RepID=A0A1N7JWQ2_9RHOB|nr:type VI secretion system-associated protein TagF [Rhodobacter aestuarii]PTV95956.1 type VI secretion system protein ImpM [Rhodobacter aestuarii]SIS53768.1 type VI secretion system protein ImpM [Rhodobacter aestuarii]
MAGGTRETGLPAGIGFAGKHPGFGDFIGLGVAPALRHALDHWLERALPEAAKTLGAAWEPVWDASPGFGFWIGGQVLAESGGAALRGWALPSRDKVGRRWPFLVLQHPAPADPPPLAADDGFAAAAVQAAHLARAARPADLAGLAPSFTALVGGSPSAAEVSSLLWAVNPALPVARLWAELAVHDHRRAASHSSYIWADPAPGRAAAVMAGPGLPEGVGLAWILAGTAAEDSPVSADPAPVTAAMPEIMDDEPVTPPADPAPPRSFDDVRD